MSASGLLSKAIIDQIRDLLGEIATSSEANSSDPWSRPQIQAKAKRLLAASVSEIAGLQAQNDRKVAALQECGKELRCRCQPIWTDRNLHAPECLAWIVNLVIDPVLSANEKNTASVATLPDQTNRVMQEASQAGLPSGTKRKPHNALPGYVAERRAKLGGYVAIFDRESGADWIEADDRWIVMHMPSSRHVAVRNRAQAYAVMNGIASCNTVNEAQAWADILPETDEGLPK